jgi:hypothetical protein
MTQEAENLDDVILDAVAAIRDEDEALQGPLNDLLAQAGETPEERRRAATRALLLLLHHPDALERLRERVPSDALGSPQIVMRTYQELLSRGTEVPAGTLMVCPEDPTHYSRRLHAKGQVLFCPRHGVRLVPLLDARATAGE